MNERVERMVDAALLKAGGDLVKRLRSMDKGWPTMLSTAADRIEQLNSRVADLERELSEEKALADELYMSWLEDEGVIGNPVIAKYDKARGM